MKSPKPIVVHIALVLVAFIYGINYIFLKQITPTPIAPVALLLTRTVGAYSFLLLVCKIAGVNEKIKNKNDWVRLVFCGLCGASINQLFFFSGISKTSAVNTSLIVISIPIFVFIISLFLKKEKLTIIKSLGIVLGMAGATLIILNSANAKQVDGDVLGDVFVLINSVLFATYLVIVNPLMKNYNALTIAKWIFLFGSLANIPIGINSFLATPWSTLTFNHYAVLVFLIIIVSAAGYIVNNWAMKFTSTTSVSFYIYLQPLFTGICAAILLNESFSLLKTMSGGLIFIGVYLINKK